MRLIDADALKAKYEQMLPEIGDGYHKETLQDVLFELEYAPTVSPDEVRVVAFWVDTQPHLDDSSYKKDGMSYYCSNCHHRAGKYKHRSYKFCPWCGARIVPKDTAIADMLPPLQDGEDKADLIEQMERFQEYAKGGAE